MILHNRGLERPGPFKRHIDIDENDLQNEARAKRGRCSSPGFDGGDVVRSHNRFNGVDGEETKEYWPHYQVRTPCATTPEMFPRRRNYSCSDVSLLDSHRADSVNHDRKYDLNSCSRNGSVTPQHRTTARHDPNTYANIVKIIHEALSAKGQNPYPPPEPPHPQLTQRHWTMRNTAPLSAFQAPSMVSRLSPCSQSCHMGRNSTRQTHPCDYTHPVQMPSTPHLARYGHHHFPVHAVHSGIASLFQHGDSPCHTERGTPVRHTTSATSLPEKRKDFVDNDIYDVFSTDVAPESSSRTKE